MKMKQFHEIIVTNWQAIISLNSTHKLVNVFADRIEAVG